jgi:hypothetical protein
MTQTVTTLVYVHVQVVIEHDRYAMIVAVRATFRT